MKKRTFLSLMTVVFAVLMVAAIPAGLQLGSVAMAQLVPVPPPKGIEGPGGVPHYFGPYGNWAFSPLPYGSIGTITVDSGGTGYAAPAVAILRRLWHRLRRYRHGNGSRWRYYRY